MWFVYLVLILTPIASLAVGNYRDGFGWLFLSTGIIMAISGFLMSAQVKRYERLSSKGIPTPVPLERYYHVWFRILWWIPIGIGLLIYYLV